MRALVVEELKADYAGCVVKEVPTPEPGPGQVRIRVRAAAVKNRACAFFDAHFFRDRAARGGRLGGKTGSSGAAGVVAPMMGRNNFATTTRSG